MKYTQDIKDKALILYSKGTTLEDISKQPGMPTRTSLCFWKKRYHWEERKLEALNKSDEILNEKLTDTAVRQRKISRNLIEKALPGIIKKLDKDDINLNEFVNLMKHELLVNGRATERSEINGDFVEDVRRAIRKNKE